MILDKMPECKYGVECDDPACNFKHTGRDEICAKYTEGFCPFGPYCRFGHKPQAASDRPPVAVVFTADPEAAQLREKGATQAPGGRVTASFGEPAPGPVPRGGGRVPRGESMDGRVDVQGRLLALVSEYVQTAKQRGMAAADASGPVAFFTVRAKGLSSLKASVRDSTWLVPEAMAPKLAAGLKNMTGGVYLLFSRLRSKAFQGPAGDAAGAGISGAGKRPPAGFRFVRVEWLYMCALPFEQAALVRNPLKGMQSAARCGDWDQVPVPVGMALVVLLWGQRKLRVSAAAFKGEIEPVRPEDLEGEDLGEAVDKADAATRQELDTGGAGEGGIGLLAQLGGPGCHQQRQPPEIGVTGGMLARAVPPYAIAAIMAQTVNRPNFAVAAAWASGPGRAPAPGHTAAAVPAALTDDATRAAVSARELHDAVDVTPFPADPEPEAGFGFLLGVTDNNLKRAIATGTVFMEDSVVAEGMAGVRVGTPVLLWHRDNGTLFGLFVALDRPKELRISGGPGKPAFVRAIAPFAIACRLPPLPLDLQAGLWDAAGVPPAFQPAGLPPAASAAAASAGSPRSGLVSRRFLADVAVRMQQLAGFPPLVLARMAAVLRHMRGLPVAPAVDAPLAAGFEAPAQAAAAARAKAAAAAAATSTAAAAAAPDQSGPSGAAAASGHPASQPPKRPRAGSGADEDERAKRARQDE
ncbi:hypothetical protein FNF29_01721 [Cafeteria roenbergensis]|uniref:C3H1-type domain-containing protein n=1 Tax=Cafeteria roenbergensis TaxID=33653 RepID=A0A5A8CQL6_CAFRO|nr:hypothetical protein FNF29_01721 [Cafeteria roenbergensis]|eukprot:KAA0155346.1 hypothetical protein FNF29_01721 [Cafeteria roenbergensis]